MGSNVIAAPGPPDDRACRFISLESPTYTSVRPSGDTEPVIANVLIQHDNEYFLLTVVDGVS